MFAKLLARSLVVLGIAAVTVGAADAQEWQKKFPLVQFGILSVENQGSQLTRFDGFTKYFKDKTGSDMKLFFASDYAGVVQALSAGQIQIAILGPASYAAAHVDSNGAVEPIATNQEISGEIGYHSVLIVKTESPYKALEDLKGKTVAWADPNSTSGYMVPNTQLKVKGIDPEKYFARTVFSGGHEQSVIGVLNGNFDAGFTWTSKEDRMGQLRIMMDRGALDRSKIRVIWESPLIPNPPLVIRKDMPPEMKRDILALFTNLNKEAPQLAEAVARGKTTGFVPVTAEMYQPFVDIVKDRMAQRRTRTN